MPSMRRRQYKRVSQLIIIAALTCWCSTRAGAEAIGSPASILKKGKWVFGLASDAVFGRGFNGNADVTVVQGGHFRGYGLTDWLSVYGKIGGAYLEVDDASIKKATTTSTTHSFGGGLLSSVQVKSKLFENRQKTWEWDGSLQYVDIRARHRGKNDGRWHEWQFGTSLARSFGNVKPYVGVKYSMIHFLYRVRENGTLLKQGRYQEQGPVGPFLGADLYLGRYDDVTINIEGAYLNGAEIALALSYSF
ncbi:MAG: hypothetical protein HYZ91_06540 [Candidatus Omnitrophica bacterium]|nr:hypothetical protein [Candidatus Omnitrophota bacterium]